MVAMGQPGSTSGLNDHRNQIRFASRLSARAVTGGVFATFAVFLFLMSFFAAVGWWNYQLKGIQNLGTGIWITSLACWIVSVYFGAYVAAIASYSSTKRDGVLNGFVTWAVACSIGCAIGFVAMAMPPGASAQPLPKGAFWVLFMGDGLAILASLMGGASGARSEARTPSQMSPEKPGVTGIHRAAS